MGRVLRVMKYVLVTIIAVSLAWIAFFKGDGNEVRVEESPYVSLDSPEISPEQGDIINEVVLSGTINTLPAVPAKVTKAGVVSKVDVKVGDTVNKDQRLGVIKYEVEPTAAPSGDPEAPAPAPVVKTVSVVAPVAGKVTSLDLVVEQQVSIGDTFAAVTPQALVFSSSLNQQDRYRLLEPPTEAELKVDGGPAPFACLNLRIEGVEVGGDTQEPRSQEGDFGGPYGGGYAEDMGGGAGVGTLLCDVPADARVFPGLSADAIVIAGEARNVLTLPVNAVAGSVEKGTVYKYDENGEPAPMEVELGLTDGERIEVRSGLSADDMVLEFAPGVESEEEDMYMGDW